VSARAGASDARRIVVKIGTRLIVGQDGEPRRGFLEALAADVATLMDEQREILIVTSGAVHLGRQVIGPGRHLDSVSMRQAAAAVGQPILMDEWVRALRQYDLTAAQVLLTQDDIADRDRCIHLRNALEALLAQRVVPVLNENDSVSVEGVTFGENDLLAAMAAAALAPADLLVYLCDQEGLYTGDPRVAKNAELIRVVEPGQDLSSYAEESGGPESTGGMRKKVEAARQATDCGIRVSIANGDRTRVLQRIAGGEELGTCFLPRTRMPSRKAWLTVHGKPAGTLIVDDGARRALLRSDGSSLLPSGIIQTRGEFQAGDLVTVSDMHGREIARGLVNYSAAEVATIRGEHSSKIAELLGRQGEDEVIHRDDMVLTGE